MKLRELLYLLGLRPKPRTYGYEIKALELARDGRVEYAQWLHPHEREKEISQQPIDELRRFLSPGDIAIDIGAHTGDSTIPIALAVGQTGCVLAFEPNKYVFPVLEKNSELNAAKTNIIPLMFAATPEAGEFEFEYSDSGYCNGGRHEGISKWRHGHAFKLTVQGTNLRSFLQETYPQFIPRIRYIKVDAEGYDRTILESISELLSRCKPYVKAEVYKESNRDERLKLYEAIVTHGYTVHKVVDESNFRGEVLTEHDLTRWRHFDVFCVPD